MGRLLQAGDVVLTLGAGDGYLVGEQLLDALRAAERSTPPPAPAPPGRGNKEQFGSFGFAEAAQTANEIPFPASGRGAGGDGGKPWVCKALRAVSSKRAAEK